MFTGLVEKISKVEKFNLTSLGAKISIQNPFDEVLKLGQSIAINGVCLSLTKISNEILEFDIMKETLEKTNFKKLKKGEIVNLERAMQINSRFDGHIVLGHIDTISKLDRIIQDGFSKRFQFVVDNSLLIEKGSIAVNGVSLTISKVLENGFEVSLIPTTLNDTNLSILKIGDFVNIEFDMFAKYIKKFSQKENSKITFEYLKENGF